MVLYNLLIQLSGSLSAFPVKDSILFSKSSRAERNKNGLNVIDQLHWKYHGCDSNQAQLVDAKMWNNFVFKFKPTICLNLQACLD